MRGRNLHRSNHGRFRVVPYDETDRLTRGVRYLDDETNLQTTDLPVPEPGEVLPGP